MNDKPLIDIDEPIKPDTEITAPEFDIVTESFEPTRLEEPEPLEEQQTNENTKGTLLSGEELAAIKEQLKEQLFNEMKDEQTRKMEEMRLRREREDKEHQKYIETMKQSPDPWVDIIGWVRTDEGVKVELEWNDAFVDYLRSNGINGADEDQIVQKWVTLLLRDMADQMEERYGSDFE